MPKLIAPSILAADFANLERDIKLMNSSAADYLHIDVMDGVFVPNISFGFPVTQAIAKHAQKPLDFHLMIVNPEQYFEQCIASGAEIISFHYEASNHIHSAIAKIKSLGGKAGVALNPHTSVDVLADIIQDVDLVLLMSVNPGFGGQKFIEHTYKKIAKTKKMIADSGSKALIEIDGGVNGHNAEHLFDAGADILVAGNFVFSSENPVETIQILKRF
jgi:ribulose-phosphate 3-epimerase